MKWRLYIGGRLLILVIISMTTILALGGCRVLRPVPIPIANQHIPADLVDDTSPPIVFGSRRPILDGLGWCVGIPDKVLLWDRRISNHRISEDTVLVMADYLEQNNLTHVKVRANQYAPLDDLKRLRKNTTVAWPWRYTLGLVSVAGEAILPGRVFGGDHFNPFTQTIHLYSDVPAIALHEGGHAKDFSRRKYQGSYAAAYLFVPIWHETIASRDAFSFLEERGEQKRVEEANRILYPAYGTYLGSGFGSFAPGASVPIYYGSVLAGHLNGRILSRDQERRGSNFGVR